MVIRVYKRVDTGTYEIGEKLLDRCNYITSCETCDKVLEELQNYSNITIEFVNEEEIYKTRVLGSFNN